MTVPPVVACLARAAVGTLYAEILMRTERVIETSCRLLCVRGVDEDGRFVVGVFFDDGDLDAARSELE